MLQLVTGILFMALAAVAPVWAALLVFAVLLGAAVIGLIISEAVVEEIRSQDVKLIEKGRIIEAYDALIAMEDYKDSAEKAASIYDRYRLENLKTAVVGDCVLLGSYDQDADASNGKDDIQWLVLDQKEDRLLLISKFGLAAQPYHEFKVDVTWEESSLRKWLNNGFINAAFSELERYHIPSVTVSAEQNPLYETDPGADTEDQVFLLSIEEVSQYFSSREERACQLAGSACSWWLRNPGQGQTFAAVIDPNGDADVNGTEVDSRTVAIRPAIWVDLQK